MDKGKRALILSIIIFLVCIAITIYVSNNRVAPTKIINKVKKEIKLEVDIADSSIKKDLSNKVDYLIYGTTIDEGYFNKYYFRRGEESIKGDIFNLDNETRLRIVLDYLNYSNKFSPLKNKVTGIEDVDSNIRFEGLDSVKQVSVNDVSKYYKILFGDIEYELENVSGCFGYYYDSKNSLYYEIDPSCGGTSDTNVYVYKTNYRKTDDTAYVDVYFGYVKEEDNTYTIYSDYNLTNKIEIKDFKFGNKFINEDNYEKFEHYRFNFKLDKDNNYYFTNISY